MSGATVTTTTAADLFLNSPEFRGFLICWQRDGRCPVTLADWLWEHDLPSQGDAAHWAASEPDVPTRGKWEGGGVYPFEGGYGWFWGTQDGQFPPESRQRIYRWDIPGDVHSKLPRVDPNHPGLGGRTIPEALVAFLDAWAVARRANK